MGNEFQQDSESALTFANRIRILGERILEAKKIESGAAVPAAFNTSVQTNLFDCFKAGLKPEIEQRSGEAANVNDVVKDAIKVERILAARRSLRKPGVSNEIKQDKRKIYICRFCNQSGHESSNCNVIPTCSICNKVGHSSDKCFSLISKNGKTEICNTCQRLGLSMP